MTLQYLRRSVDPVNQYRRWIDPRVRTLKLTEVTAYLRQHSWRELPPDRPGLRAFQEPTGRRCQINSTVCIFPLTRVGGVTNVI